MSFANVTPQVLIAHAQKAINATPPGEWKDDLQDSLMQFQTGRNRQRIFYLLMLKRYPVDIETFLFSKDYMDGKGHIWPELVPYIKEVNNPDGDRLGMKYHEVVLTGGIGCFDAETEYMSPYGWRKISQYDGGPVLQYHEDGSTSFVEEPEYVELPCEKFYHFHTKYGVDQMLSPEHRIIYESPKKPGELKVSLAESVYNNHTKTKKGWVGRFRTTFKAPVRGGVSFTPEQLRVMTMVAADGYIRTDGSTYCHLRVKKQRKLARAEGLLKAAGIPYTYKLKCDGYHLLRFYAPAPHKLLSKWAYDCTAEQLAVVVEEAQHWDGSITEGKTGFRWYTKSKDDADFMSYAGSACGWKTSVYPDKTEFGAYVLKLCDRPLISMQGTPKTEIDVVPAVDGKKYCFMVPTEMLVVRRNGQVVISGNTAKTTQALYGLAYQLYVLSCYREPHLVLGQDPSAEILFIFQSINSKVAMSDYKRFRNMIQRSPYFRDNFDFRRDIETTMIFPHRIEVQPVTGEVNATIGQNVIGGLIDEINFMIKTKKSKKVQDGDFDQAAELYSSIDSRRRSRFMDMGYLPGLLYLSSSKNYPGQFTDMKEKQAVTDKGIYYWDKRVWELRPDKYCGKKFWLYVGDISSQPFIVTAKNPAPRDAEAKGLLDQIPIEFLKKFEQDIYRSLREIAGRSALSTHPFIPNAAAIARVFRPAVMSVVAPCIIDFDAIMPMGYACNILNREQPRAVHVDLAINGDMAGVSCGYVEKFVQIDDEGEKYHMPLIRYDFTLGVKAPNTSGGEIKFSSIRKMLVDLRAMGLPIKWVTFDTYQSKDSQQILRSLGFLTGEVSMDVTPIPYDCFKTAINQGRVISPVNDHVQLECVRLERGPDGKVDHPADGSKDMSDSMAGVAYLLTMRKEIWMMHGIQPRVISRDVSRKI